MACIWAKRCSRRSWTSCRGRPSIASWIATAAIIGYGPSAVPSSFASWPSRSLPTASACAMLSSVWLLTQASSTTSALPRRSHAPRGSIPTFSHISDGKLHDVNVLDLLIIEAGAFYIMDRGYLDFERLYALDQAGGFFVTRGKRHLDARRLYSAPVDRNSGLICDQRIVPNGYHAPRH